MLGVPAQDRPALRDWANAMVGSGDPQISSPQKAHQAGELSNIKGMEREATWRIEEARIARPFVSIRDLADRATLAVPHIQALALASANALPSLVGNRRQAMLNSASRVTDKGLLRDAAIEELPIQLESASEA